MSARVSARAAEARSPVCPAPPRAAARSPRGSGVGVLYSWRLSQVPQSGHLPIHLGWTEPQELQRNWVLALAMSVDFSDPRGRGRGGFVLHFRDAREAEHSGT